ncbi:MAG: response regulator, partial [Ignavibacteriales bacterium]|nr:response regulator [Ignavibacteriales bacterium]
MRILIVEDEGIVAKDIRRFVEQLGYSMAGYASTGEEALSAMRQSQPDLILLDIGLRGSIDGVETARRIHESFDTPIIFLTAYSDHATLQRAKETNPFGYLLKPFEERELYSAVEMARHRYSLEKALRVSEARFRDLFDEAPIGYHELDKEGNITRINRTELEMAGYTQEEMVGHCIADFLMEAEDARASLKEKLSGRKPVGQIFERTYRRKDGSTLPVSIVEKLVYDNRGKILGLRTTVVNISERKQAEYERNRQAAHLVDLTQAAARFAEMQYDDDVYAFIGSFLRD